MYLPSQKVHKLFFLLDQLKSVYTPENNVVNSILAPTGMAKTCHTSRGGQIGRAGRSGPNHDTVDPAQTRHDNWGCVWAAIRLVRFIYF